MNNIVLIGMPGVGKSTVGVILAKILGYKFVDTDLIIQEKTGKLLKDLIKENGVDGFIKIENDICSELEVKNTVVATGGSVVYGSDAMKHLMEIGTVVYLSLNYSDNEKRLGNIKGRGVVLRKGQSLMELYDERLPLYEKYSHIIVSEDDCDIEQTIQKITEVLQGR